MANEILYTTAKDKSGKLIHIDNAEKGKTYYCPTCSSKFILRKSGNTVKGSKRPHFAHNHLTTNCTPEGVLHYSFKKKLVDLLNEYLSENKELVINWICNDCTSEYPKESLSTNLLEEVVKIEEEYNLKVCRPDIALLDEKNEVIAVVEVVVTHEPEENVLKHYESNGITLIQINLSNEEDLVKVKEKIINPTLVIFCLNPECVNFKNHLVKRKLLIQKIRCKQCRYPMLKPFVLVESVFGKKATFNFTKEEIKLAQSKGVRFKVLEDKKSIKKRLVYSCERCEILTEQARANIRRMRNRYKPRRF